MGCSTPPLRAAFNRYSGVRRYMKGHHSHTWTGAGMTAGGRFRPKWFFWYPIITVIRKYNTSHGHVKRDFGVPGGVSGAVFRLFPLIYGPDAPRNGSPGGERGFWCPVTVISGWQAGFKALERYLALRGRERRAHAAGICDSRNHRPGLRRCRYGPQRAGWRPLYTRDRGGSSDEAENALRNPLWTRV